MIENIMTYIVTLAVVKMYAINGDITDNGGVKVHWQHYRLIKFDRS